MTQDVLTVFGSHPDHHFSILRSQSAIGKIADIREKLAPLSSQQVNKVQAFGLSLQDGCPRREKVNVSVGADPTLRAQIGESRNLQIQLPLARLDLQSLTDSFVLKPFRHFQKNFAHWQLNLECPIDVCEGT